MLLEKFGIFSGFPINAFGNDKLRIPVKGGFFQSLSLEKCSFLRIICLFIVAENFQSQQVGSLFGSGSTGLGIWLYENC
jgi:hypothetical protein|tara:strand:- start:889 stop:1125 length:237 start_codon:yes stop_codon:yes gene_type:complete